MSSHVIPLKIYWGIFLALIALTGLTVFVAYIDLGPFNLFVALAVASVKAVLVVLYFMHVKYSERLIGASILGGVFWLVVMLVFLVADYFSRSWIPVEGW